jgi:hypothetical protein
MGAMFNLRGDAPEMVVPEEPKDTPALRTRRARILIFVGVWMFGASCLIHYMSPVPTLACRPESRTTASCVVTRTIFFGLIPRGSVHIAGVRGARSVEHIGVGRRSSNSYHVMLDTPDGERRVGSSFDVDPAIEMVHLIKLKLAAGAPFQTTFSFSFMDWLVRSLGLVLSLASVGTAVAGLIALRRARVAGAGVSPDAAADV